MGLICTPYGYSGAAKVSGLVTYQSKILADKPVAYWPLNETSGTVANDLSGNGFNMAYQNSPTLGSAAIAPGLGNSVSLNGSNQFVELASPPSALQLVEGSFEIWCNLVTAPGGTGLFTGAYESSSINFTLAFGSTLGGANGANLGAGLYTGSGWEGFVGSALAVGKPYHVVGTFNGATYTLYVNGIAVGSASVSSITPNANPIYVGSRWDLTSQGSNYLNASLSNAAIYNTVLTADQIQNHYNAGIGA